MSSLGVGWSRAPGAAHVLTVIADASVSAVAPAHGPAAGGTLVSVYGAGFVDEPELRCRFAGGAIVAPAAIRSPNWIECVSPGAGSEREHCRRHFR